MTRAALRPAPARPVDQAYRDERYRMANLLRLRAQDVRELGPIAGADEWNAHTHEHAALIDLVAELLTEGPRGPLARKAPTMIAMHTGALEDSKPCPFCACEYVFLVGDDPGLCPGCRRLEHAAAEVDKANRRVRRRVVRASS
jgi:hypothetical protein